MRELGSFNPIKYLSLEIARRECKLGLLYLKRIVERMPPTVQDGALSIRLPPTYNPKGPPDQMKDMLPNNIQPGAFEISTSFIM